MKKLMIAAFAFSLSGIAGIGTANAEAIETVTARGLRNVTVSENPTPPVSYRALQRERMRYYMANGTPRRGSYAQAVLRGCYWNDQGRICSRFN